MARPRKFDEAQVLDRVVDLFRKKGYEATSMDDIESVTGLGRSSLYTAFKGKRQIFLSALNRYDSVWIERLLEASAAEPTGRKAIEKLLHAVLSQSTKDPAGCLMANSAMEVGLRDPGVARSIRANRRRVESAMRAAIDRGRADGSIKHGESAGNLARYLFVLILGLRVFAKSGASGEEMSSLVKMVLRQV
jgi:TetR/AcrR family transcriptional repressor of nem operon